MGRTDCTERQCLYKGDLYVYLFLMLSKLFSIDLAYTEQVFHILNLMSVFLYVDPSYEIVQFLDPA